MNRSTKIVGFVVAVLALPPVGYAVLLNLPTSIALGPCLKDWTSPSSYNGPRASKLATVDVPVDDAVVRLCYGRPSARDRVVFGGIVPFDRLWRAGANEPTRLFTAVPLDFGGLALDPGRYSLYALPTAGTWDIFVSTSTFHWGNAISRSVRDREVGSISVPVDSTERHVELFTLRGEPDGSDARLVIEWERTRVTIPLRRGG